MCRVMRARSRTLVRDHSIVHSIPVAVRGGRSFIDLRAVRGCVARHVIFGWLEKTRPYRKKRRRVSNIYILDFQTLETIVRLP